MDPFTEKLLERTRARRENLQKKLAERPNAANRAMAKRSREPLTDTNSVISESGTSKVPQLPSRPSPSKRRCSEENVQPAADEENQEPVVTPAGVPVLIDPPTDKKPPMVPTNTQPSPSSEKPSAQPGVQKKVDLDMIPASPCPDPQTNREEQMQSLDSALQKNKEEPMDNSTSSGTGMKSRFQRLAEQRRGWDGTSTEVPDCTPLSLKPAEVQPPALPTPSSGAPLGRRGRLANLAVTIGSWEDDLSHASVPKEKPGPAPVRRFPVVDASPGPSNRSAAASSSAGKSGSSSAPGMRFLPKSHQAAHPSPQQADPPASKAACKPAPEPSSQSVPSPKKIPSTAVSHSPQKNQALSGGPNHSPLKNQALSGGPNYSPLKNQPPSGGPNHSPLKNQALSGGPNYSPQKNQALSGGPHHSPHKPGLCEKPSVAGASTHQQKVSSGAPVVKSFLERFGERCQERSNQTTARAAPAPKTSAESPGVARNTQLVQERLKAAQAAHTTTAELTQRQKLERESELARIRSRFQKGNNVWENKDEGAKTKTDKTLEEPVLDEPVQCERQDEPPAPVTESADTLQSTSPVAGPGPAHSPPASASTPLKPARSTERVTTEETSSETPETEEEKEVEINSMVINELFDGVLEQSDDQTVQEGDEDEEEDALNISSMSLLAPLTETVAAVVKSPQRRLVTSTPASSFNEKTSIPPNISKASKFQRSTMIRTASSESLEASDEDPNLPYSIDAYRSTRVKEMERSSVKQVTVPKEDVSQRDEARGASLFSLKQKTKILTNEMNLQQTVIHQASQALNCCTDEEHGKGSQVEAEAERLLLVATEKRELLKAELERLRGDPTGRKRSPVLPQSDGVPASKGSVTLQEFRLPLKADFVCSIVNKPESTKHSFFMLLHAGAEHAVATPLASTHCGLSGDTLTFPTKFTLSDVSSDFEVALEVYCLVQKRELCSDKKKKSSKSKAITPKRFLANKSAHTPVMASPGGPNAVRTSNFVLVGSHKFTLASIGKNKFPLEKVPFLCPLEGHVYIRMQCDVGSKVEERGFLTMFEDVSGFGAWHRRWCVLSGYCISYWTYPDDEKRKNPIGRLNLSSCTSRSVEPAKREFCARPNTFELITVRPQRDEDKETLVSQCKNTMCVTKNWLSADTKDERNLWMKKLNQILVDLRMWQPDACYRPQ
ncbi:anillin [Cololabis saira]|uniref:anillin n=1 Tax=Cololabis saira TaxID=129043 RepID=UPI002AD244AF|nr:anillin [Cololabis saira]